MSEYALKSVIEYGKFDRKSEFSLMLAIADSADDENWESTASIKYLCERAYITENTYHRAKHDLVKKGVLKISYNLGSGDEGRKTNLYKINLPFPKGIK